MVDYASDSGFEQAQFSPGFLDHGGPYWLRKLDGRTLVGLRLADHHRNYRDAAHGGVMATLADVALSYQAYNHDQPQVPVVTSSMTVNYLSPAAIGHWIVADAQVDRIGARQAHVSGQIWDGDRLLATISGVYVRIRPKPA